jgi:hypothetical protein
MEGSVGEQDNLYVSGMVNFMAGIYVIISWMITKAPDVVKSLANSYQVLGWRKRRHRGRLMAMDDFVWIAQATCFQLLWIRRVGSWLVEMYNRLFKTHTPESAIKEFLDILY